MEERPAEVSILIASDDPALDLWVRDGLGGLRYELCRTDRISEKPMSGGADPDLALVEEDAGSDFPARLRAFKNAYPRCQLFLVSKEDSELSPRALAPVTVRHWFFRPVDADELGRVLRAAGQSLRRQWQEEHRRARAVNGFEVFVGQDARLLEALELARKAASSRDTSVLILGETGTGKGLLAQAIHGASPRRTGPFIDINCATIPTTLVESELFGHTKGAFTGAHRDKPGLIELADGGTAFLDEIGEVDLMMQAKLLKVLDSGMLRRVSATEETKVDVRILAATNRDLEAEAESGRFRPDLFHRLNVVAIRLPALRERPQDIGMLAQHYASILSRRLKGTVLEWSPEAVAALKRYNWPGNVRELINLTERAVLMGDGTRPLTAEDLPKGILPSTPVFSQATRETKAVIELPEEGISFREVEKALLEAALLKSRGNVTQAARLLRMSRGSLRYRLDKLGLKDRAAGRRGRPRRRRAA